LFDGVIVARGHSPVTVGGLLAVVWPEEGIPENPGAWLMTAANPGFIEIFTNFDVVSDGTGSLRKGVNGGPWTIQTVPPTVVRIKLK